MNKKIIVFFVVLFNIVLVQAQDVGFSQFYANKLYLNPALAGTTNCPLVAVNYRNYFPTITNAYTTYSASIDQYKKSLHGGVGLLIMRDEQGKGTINTSSVSGMYNYTFRVTNNFRIKAGLQASLILRNIDTDGLVFPDMIDPFTGEIGESKEIISGGVKNHVAFSSGIVAYTKKLYFGIAAHHLNEWKELENQEKYDILQRKYTFHIGYKFPITNRETDFELSVSPNLVAQMQGEFKQINYGFYANYKSIVTGIWLRQNFGIDINSVTLLLGYTRESFRLGYSFEIPINELSASLFAAHEISLLIYLPCKQKSNKYRAISCPKF